MKRVLLVALLLVLPTAAFAQIPDLSTLLPAGQGSASGRIIQMVALLTVLSLAPGLLIMVTSFTRFVVALSFLRAGLGLQTTPANIVLISLALFMTFYVMAPTFDRAWQNGVQPLMENEISEEEAYSRDNRSVSRIHAGACAARRTCRSFDEPRARGLHKPGRWPEDRPPRHHPGVHDLRAAPGFEIGFLIVLPFLVIDMIVATLTMSMGMMMMPPTVLALPFKMLFFVLIDGWNLLVVGLVRSFL